jgi:TolB-like protein/Tfp pilus assembly protein PilF
VAERTAGSRLGPYEILGPLGQGGMGQVLRARDGRLGREVAIKVLSADLLMDENARSRVHKEAVVLARLKHRNIAHLYDVLAVEGTEALVMELVEGPTLAEKLQAGPLPEAEAVRLGVQLADGLAAAHAEGIVHCDLKPANVKLPPGGDLKILDFGIAKLRRAGDLEGTTGLETLTSTSRQVAGTLPYMAPEQLRADPLDARTDVWAAGVVLCEMSTGQRPFEGTVAARVTDAILHASPAAVSAPDSGLSNGLRGILRKCLQKDPEDRYATAEQLREDLETLRTQPSRPAIALPSGAVRPGRGRLVTAGLVAAAALVALAVASDVGGLRTRAAGLFGPRKIDSLAVLPLANLSRDPEQEYFADGMTESMIAELSKIKALKVISRTSVMKYKNTRETLPEIGKALGVRGVVEGSVMRDGKTVRITVQLIDAASDRHLWAESYTRADRDVLALQSEVASAIAREVRVAVSPEERGRLGAERPVNPEAHRLVLLGSYAIAQPLTQRAGIEKGIEFFRQAVREDPGFALAHLRLGEALRWSGFAGYRPMAEACAESRAEAEKAIELDPMQGEAFATLASLKRACQFDWAGAASDLRRAAELSPGSAFVHTEAAYLASILGNHEEAIRESRTAEQLDPLTEQVAVFTAQRLWYARRYAECEQQVQKALAQHPGSVFAQWTLANAYAGQKRYDEAIAVFLARKVPEPAANFALGLTYGLAGRKDEARKVLDRLLEKRKSAFLPPTQIAIVYAGLGEKEAAWAWLKQAYDDKAWQMDELAVDPLFDVFRSDPRFAGLVRDMKLPEAR